MEINTDQVVNYCVKHNAFGGSFCIPAIGSRDGHFNVWSISVTLSCLE